MKVKNNKKMYFKKAVIAKMNTQSIKGGTRSFQPGHIPTSGLESHCEDVVCY